MKKMIIAGITLATLAASAAQYRTVTVCDRGESGTECQTITYVERASEGVPAEVGNSSDEYMVRPAKRSSVPRWLRALNEAFPGGGRHGKNSSNPGFEAP